MARRASFATFPGERSAASDRRVSTHRARALWCWCERGIRQGSRSIGYCHATIPPALLHDNRRARKREFPPYLVHHVDLAYVLAARHVLQRDFDLHRHRFRTRGRQLRGFDGAHLKGLHTLLDRKSTRLNSSHLVISYAVFCLKK